MTPFAHPGVAAVFDTYPADVKPKLLQLRERIFAVACRTPGVGALEEALRWNQPGYITAETRSGSLIRIDRVKSQPGRYAMYVHCQTNLVATYRDLYASLFTFEGNRALLFDAATDVPEQPLCHCIELALTYHLNKR